MLSCPISSKHMHSSKIRNEIELKMGLYIKKKLLLLILLYHCCTFCVKTIRKTIKTQFIWLESYHVPAPLPAQSIQMELKFCLK